MSLHVHNLCDGQVITYSLALLIGEVEPLAASPAVASILVYNTTTGHKLPWPLVHGRFKILVDLQKGKNVIELRYFAESRTITLDYQVPAFTRFVRPVYIRCCDESGSFQGPDMEDTSAESACRRVALGARLLQTFTAEKLHAHSLGRKTFVLEKDLDPTQPECHMFTSKLKVSEAHAMSGADLWMYFARELMSSRRFPNKDKCKWFSFTAFTRYQPPSGTLPKSHSEVLKYTKGYTALGGGGLALFATGNLHTWAERLDEVPARFTDTRKIDRSKYMDDSAYRQYHWANYSTGLGSALHELGHTFDLGHTPTGVMARGFDDLYKVFSIHSSGPGGCGGTPRCCGKEASLLASTSSVAYSPTQSPVHTNRYHTQGQPSAFTTPPPSPLSTRRPSSLSQIHHHHHHQQQASSHTSPMHHIPASSLSSSSSSSAAAASSSLSLQYNHIFHHPTPTPPTSPTNHTDAHYHSVPGSGPYSGPEMVQIETAFQKLHTNATQTFTILNYDGSSTQRTVIRHKNGTETSSELHVETNGDQTLKETIKHISTGNTRTTMSMSRSMQGLCDEANDDNSDDVCNDNQSDPSSTSVSMTTNSHLTNEMPSYNPRTNSRQNSNSYQHQTTPTENGNHETNGSDRHHTTNSVSVDSVTGSPSDQLIHEPDGNITNGDHCAASGHNSTLQTNGGLPLTKQSQNRDQIACKARNAFCANGVATVDNNVTINAQLEKENNPEAAVNGSVSSSSVAMSSSSSGNSSSSLRSYLQNKLSASFNTKDTSLSNSVHNQHISMCKSEPKHKSVPLHPVSVPNGTDSSNSNGRNDGAKVPSYISAMKPLPARAAAATRSGVSHARIADAVPSVLTHKDGGAHWYRSSSVMLRFHKWFNPPNSADPNVQPELNGCWIRCAAGIRLVELRSVPEGVVFHHWEFLHKKPPTSLKLIYHVIYELSNNASEMTVLVADDYGNILKKKVSISDLQVKHTDEVLAASKAITSTTKDTMLTVSSASSTDAPLVTPVSPVSPVKS